MSWGDVPGCSYNHKSLHKRGTGGRVRVRIDVMLEAEVRERFEDALLLLLKMPEGAMSQGLKATLRSYKRQENRLALRTFRKNKPC